MALALPPPSLHLVLRASPGVLDASGSGAVRSPPGGAYLPDLDLRAYPHPTAESVIDVWHDNHDPWVIRTYATTKMNNVSASLMFLDLLYHSHNRIVVVTEHSQYHYDQDLRVSLADDSRDRESSPT